MNQGRGRFGIGPSYQDYFQGKVAHFLVRQINTESRVFEDALSESAILKKQGRVQNVCATQAQAGRRAMVQ